GALLIEIPRITCEAACRVRNLKGQGSQLLSELSEPRIDALDPLDLPQRLLEQRRRITRVRIIAVTRERAQRCRRHRTKLFEVAESLDPLLQLDLFTRLRVDRRDL